MHTEIGNRENEEIDIQTQAKARKILPDKKEVDSVKSKVVV